MNNGKDQEFPLVSVIINCFNGDKYLFEAIQSVLNQTYPKWEIILWDNVSSVDIKSIALSFDDSRIKYFRADFHTSLGEARNQAIGLAQGEFLAFLDSDDLWREDKLSKQIELFRKDQQVVLVYTDVISFNSMGDKKRHGEHKKYCKGEIFGRLLEDYFLIMSSVIIKASTYFENKITFNSKFQMVEESDVFLRISMYGLVDYVDEVLSYWRVHQNSVTWKNYNLIASESEVMINELIKDFPVVQQSYAKNLKNKKEWILRQKILSFWLSGDSSGARSIIIKNFFNLSLKNKSFYLLTWLSPKLIAKPLFKFFSSTVSPD